jgi:hypothetical protein
MLLNDGKFDNNMDILGSLKLLLRRPVTIYFVESKDGLVFKNDIDLIVISSYCKSI